MVGKTGNAKSQSNYTRIMLYGTSLSEKMGFREGKFTCMCVCGLKSVPSQQGRKKEMELLEVFNGDSVFEFTL